MQSCETSTTANKYITSQGYHVGWVMVWVIRKAQRLAVTLAMTAVHALIAYATCCVCKMSLITDVLNLVYKTGLQCCHFVDTGI